MASSPQCTALNVSDEKSCEEVAASLNGLFCTYHSKVCQDLYKGYKRRNAQLDDLKANPPPYLAKSKTPLSSQAYADVTREAECKEIHNYLFKRCQLLNKVIAARKLHHSRFFSQTMDYGHAKYLDQLLNERRSVNTALEKIERRMTEILYENQKWFKWVRQCQDDEEAARDKEAKKAKLENAMFRRYIKEMNRRQKELRDKESRKRQDIFLERLYKARMAEKQQQQPRGGEEEEEDWDPIEEVLEDHRGNYIDLIKHFLWFNGPRPEDLSNGKAQNGTSDIAVEKENTALTEATAILEETSNSAKGKGKTDEVSNEVVEPDVETSSLVPKSKSSKKNKRKKAGNSNNESSASSELPNAATLAAEIEDVHISQSSKAVTKGKKKAARQAAAPEMPDKGLIETIQEMHDRLATGMDYDYSEISGFVVGGTLENPAYSTKTIPMDEDDIQRLQDEIAEIKHLLFCRLLLGHATLLPAALRADSVESFFEDPEVTEQALRDLALKMEKPSPQEIRDACADFFRDENEEDFCDDEEENPGTEIALASDDSDDDLMFRPKRSKNALPKTWQSKKEKDEANKKSMRENLGMFDDVIDQFGEDMGGARVDFGHIKDGKFKRNKIRVKICGHSIWNYPSDKAMNRGGWLHFSIIAKDSTLYEAVGLCRHWDEFFELNILAIYKYFPTGNWANWVGSQYKQQMLSLGFIMYAENSGYEASNMTFNRTGGSRHGPGRKTHHVMETRNFICAHMKRDDPVSRRLIQYLALQSCHLLLLVRDAETGKLVATPPEEERWIVRSKEGYGRAGKNEWRVLQSIGPEFFELCEKKKGGWSFGFKEYYDVYIWDTQPGQTWSVLYNLVQKMLFKAHRACAAEDLYNPAAPFLKTMSQDPITYRVRDIKPSEKSMYDILMETGLTCRTYDIGEEGLIPSKFEDKGHIFYNKADAVEDAVLFPEELEANVDPKSLTKIEFDERWEDKGFSVKRFAYREYWYSDSDEEDDTEEDWESDEDWDYEDESEDDRALGAAQQNRLLVEDGHLSSALSQLAIKPQTTEETVQDITKPKTVEEMVESLIDTLPPDMKYIMDKMKTDKRRRDHDKRRRDHELGIGEPDHALMEEELKEYFDKEKARLFKKIWHKADLEPHAQEHWTEMHRMVKASQSVLLSSYTQPAFLLSYALMRWFDTDNRSDNRSMTKAVTYLAPFFFPEFLESEKGAHFKESLLFKQEERAKVLPDVRSHHSNSTRPQEFWKDWQAIGKTLKAVGDIPLDWEIATRPIIAHFYKTGVIRPSTDDYAAGQAIAAKDTGKNYYDLFFDWLPLVKTVQLPKSMTNPYEIPPHKATARKFAIQNPNARFAVIRIWSSPHFYPLVIGFDNHESTSFCDIVGRKWIWMFIPKDMPNSEWSMQKISEERIKPFKRLFGKNVAIKRNVFLVMAKDEQELAKLATATVFAIQRRPWRLEVDLWKSFINVDIEFVERLNDWWLE